MRSLIPNPSVEPNDTLLTIIPKRIIDNARLSIAKKIPLNLLTKNPKKKETIKPDKIEKVIRTKTSLICKKLYVIATAYPPSQ